MTDTPRVRHLDPPYDPGVEALLSALQPKNSQIEPLKLFRTIARNLPLGQAMFALGGFMLRRDPQNRSFDLRSRELVIDRVTARCGCEYEWGVHVAAFGEKAELTADQIYSLVHGSGADACWSEDDRATLEFVDELHDTGKVSDATWAAVSRRLGEATLLELLVLAGWYHAISYFANGACTEFEHWAPRFPVKRS